jgi:hypothetical protein
LLPYLAAGGNEEAWRVFVVRYRPRILRKVTVATR